MTQTYSTESLAQRLHHLGLPFADFFARALVALLTGRKISLHQVTHLMPGEQNPEANRQQIRRCLDHESLTQEAWSTAIAALLPRTKWTLAIDRTEWKRGDTTMNLLVLAVVAYGCAVPLLWTVMPDCGASDTAERKELLGRFIALFGKERMRFVSADREFIGFDWISWLLQEKIPFRIRITRAGTGTRQGSTFCILTDGSRKRATGLLCEPAVVKRRGWIYGDCPFTSGASASMTKSISSLSAMNRASFWPIIGRAGRSRRCFKPSKAEVLIWNRAVCQRSVAFPGGLVSWHSVCAGA